MRNAERTVHPIPPEYDSQSRILILGSFPSVRSRADGFFYAHPGNRFWRIMEVLYSVSLPDIPSRKLFLHVGYRLYEFRQPDHLMLGIGIRL